MKIILIQPPIEDFYCTPQRIQPTGLIYIASYLASKKIECEIIDLLYPAKPRRIPIESELKYLQEYYPEDSSPFRIFSDYFRFGKTAGETADVIKKSEADVYGISSNFTAYYKTAAETAKIIKSIFPDKPIIIGGNNAQVMYEYFLSENFVDFVVFNEGERTLEELLNNLDYPEKVSNIAYKKNGNIVKTEIKNNYNINDTFFKIDHVHSLKYSIGRDRMMSIVTSRGCPYSCGFCSANNNVFGYTRKSIDIVKEELKYNISKFNITALNFEDENFTAAPYEYLNELCGLVKNNFPGMRLFFMNGLHYVNLDDDMLKLLRSTGMKNLNISIVDVKSSDYGRITDIEKLRKLVKAAKLMDMIVTVYFILGMPGQTIEDIIETIGLLLELDIVLGPSIFYPLPFLKICKKNEMQDIAYSQMRMTALSVEKSGFSRRDIMTLFRFCRIANLKKTMKSNLIKNILIDQCANSIGYSVIKPERDEIADFLLNRMIKDNSIYGIKNEVLKNNKYQFEYFPHCQNSELLKKSLEIFHNKW